MPKLKTESIEDRYIVPGLKRGLELLQLCTRHSGGIALTDAAQHLGISRSSTFRLLYTLEKMGFIRRAADERKFVAGLQVMNLRANVVQTDVGAAAAEPMRRLRIATGASVHLGARDGRDLLYTHSLSSLARVTTNIGAGTRLPAHATSMGRLLLSELSEADLRALYRNVRLEARTEHTVTTVGRLVEQVRADAERGYIISEGNFDPAIWSIAAPIRNHTGAIVAAISITLPAGTVEKSQFRGPLKDQVCAAAAEISAFLGHQTPAAG
ncbi:MAG: IclR family transcriptional regulator [Steroidobacteraceae bacterium]